MGHLLSFVSSHVGTRAAEPVVPVPVPGFVPVPIRRPHFPGPVVERTPAQNPQLRALASIGGDLSYVSNGISFIRALHKKLEESALYDEHDFQLSDIAKKTRVDVIKPSYIERFSICPLYAHP